MEGLPYYVLLGWLMAPIFALPQAAIAAPMIRVSDASLCLDGMETVPDNDDLEPILIEADGVCILPQTPISI